MLTALFGNRTVEKILLFLFLNETCYGAQLQTLLKAPLTPIQKGLNRLEKGGIIEGRFEGKKKIYRLSPSYPLKEELEQILKKTYTLLPSLEKKKYCIVHNSKSKQSDLNRQNELLSFWQRLSRAKQLRITTKSKKGDEKTIQTGIADVIATIESSSRLVFHEKGIWIKDALPSSNFSNQFRWTLHLDEGRIGLEHLRYGAQQPVFLMYLTPTRPNILESIDAHLCGRDSYLGHIVWDEKGIHLHWRVIGQNKNDELHYQYH